MRRAISQAAPDAVSCSSALATANNTYPIGAGQRRRGTDAAVHGCVGGDGARGAAQDRAQRGRAVVRRRQPARTSRAGATRLVRGRTVSG
jgi:hypothetical protein